MEPMKLIELCDNYIEAVIIHYGGDHADIDDVAGELLEQSNNADAHEVILDRKPTEQEADFIYVYLRAQAKVYGSPKWKESL